MAHPILIDTDMGGDDCLALALAIASAALEVVGVVSVGGNVPVEQATDNIARVLGVCRPSAMPRVARGADQDDDALDDATSVFGADGLGGVAVGPPARVDVREADEVYRELIGRYGASLAIAAIGPLTNLAGLLRRDPDLLRRAGRLVVMGGAVWCKGNVTPAAEFNFYRDPSAAAAVLSAGLDTTVVSLDLSRQVAFDESHLAHLAAGGGPVGAMLSKVLAVPVAHDGEVPPGRMLIHDALAVASLIWPELFLRTSTALAIATEGPDRGRSRPTVGGDAPKVRLLTTVNVVDLLENLLETLCGQRFVV